MPMHEALSERVSHFVKQHQLLSCEDRVLVGLSGGADSVALFRVLLGMKQKGELKDLVCVHFNHQLRSQANEDEAFVRNLCDVYQTELIVRTEDIYTLAKEQHSSIETCARNWRRNQFRALAQTHQLTSVATGHHQDDNVETLLHRLQRGTAYRGLCGIRPSRALGNITLISPLLCVTRQNIRSYLHSLKQSWQEDTTNQDQRMTRNYIRHTLVPYLSDTQPSITETLQSLALHTHALYTNTIEPHAQRLLETYVVFHEGCVELSLPSLEKESPLVISELSRLIFERLDIPQRDVTAFHYNTLLKRIYSKQGRLTLPGDIEVKASNQVLKFSRPSAQTTIPVSKTEISLNGTTAFGNLAITSRVVSTHDCSVTQSTEDKHTECFDMDKLVLPLYVRTRQTGDRFTPLGKRQPVKVGKFLSKAKVDKFRNLEIVLVCDQVGIQWVCPIRMSDGAKLSDKTRRVLEISVTKTDPGT